MWDLDVLPCVGGKVVHGCLVSAVTLLESSEDDHVCRLVVNYSGVLVAQEDLITTRTRRLPGHSPQV